MISFFLCLCSFFAVCFVNVLVFQAAILAFFLCLCLKQGIKVRILNSVLILLFSVLFSVLSPAGRVIFEAGKLPVTEGALFGGMLKGLRLCSMVFVSKYMLRKNFLSAVKTKGILSGPAVFFDRVEGIFVSLADCRFRFSPKTFFSDIDDVLSESWKKLHDEPEIRSE